MQIKAHFQCRLTEPMTIGGAIVDPDALVATIDFCNAHLTPDFLQTGILNGSIAVTKSAMPPAVAANQRKDQHLADLEAEVTSLKAQLAEFLEDEEEGATSGGGDEINANPAAIKLAAKEGMDLTTITGTGADGKINKADVKKAVAARDAPPG